MLALGCRAARDGAEDRGLRAWDEHADCARLHEEVDGEIGGG